MTPLERDLETDLALSERQVFRYHGLTLEDCLDAGLSVQPVLIAPTVHRKVTRAVNFVMLELLEFQPFEFRHLAGTAEIRHQLQVDARDWQVVQHAAQTSPDAIWHRGLKTWAVEFDASAYSRSVLLEKAQAFRAGFDGQVWAVSSSARAATVGSVVAHEPLIVHPF
jgi:phage FluMu protein gp41